jgi:hypothetical protein
MSAENDNKPLEEVKAEETQEVWHISSLGERCIGALSWDALWLTHVSLRF